MASEVERAFNAIVRIVFAGSQDAERAAGALREIGDAAEDAAKPVETTEKASRGLQRSFANLERQLDPLAKATERLAREQRTINDAFESGLIVNARGVADLEKRDRLLTQVQGNFDRYKRKVEEATRETERLDRANGGLTSGFDAIKGRLGVLIGAVGGLTTAFGAFRAVQGTLRLADDIADSAAQANATVEGLQELQFAAGQSGSSADELAGALRKLTANLGEFAETGKGPAATALKSLFTTFEQAELVASKSDVAFRKIAERLSEIEDPARRTALAVDLFGREAGAKLAPLLAQGSDGLQKFADEARRLGLVLEEDLVQKGGAAQDAIQKVQETLQKNISRAILENVDGITQLAEGLANLIPQAVGAANAFLQFVGAIQKSPSQKIKDIQSEIRLERAFQNAPRQRLQSLPAGPLSTLRGLSDQQEIARSEARIKALELQLSAARSAQADALDEEYRRDGLEGLRQQQAAQDRLNASKRIQTQLERSAGNEAKKTQKAIEDQAKASEQVVQNLKSRINSASDPTFIDRGFANRDEFRELAREIRNLARSGDISAGTAEDLVRQLEEGADRAGGSIKDAGRDFAERVKGASVFDRINTVGEGAERFGAVLDDLSDAVNVFRNSAERSLSAVLGAVSNIGRSLGGSLSNLGQFVGENISKLFGDVLKGAGAFGKAVSQTVDAVRATISLIKALFSKPSGFQANAVVDLASGRTVGTAQRDNSEQSNENARARDSLVQSITSVTERIAELTGAAIVDKASTSFRDNLFNVQVDARNGILVGNQGNNGELVNTQQFASTDEGVRLAIESTVKRFVDALEGGDERLVRVAKALAAANTPAEDFVEELNEAAETFKRADELIAGQSEEINKWLSGLNELRTLYDDIIKKTVALGASTAELEASRTRDIAQFVNGINQEIADRLLQATNPTRFDFDQLLSNQRKELEAAQQLLTEGFAINITALQRLQSQERVNFFRGLSDEEKAALGDFAGEIEDFAGRVALLSDQINEGFEKQIEGAQRLRDELAESLNFYRTAAESLASTREDIFQRFFPGNPGQQVDALRQRVVDLQASARQGNRSAIEAIPQVVNQFVERSREVNASSSTFQSDLNFALGVLSDLETFATDEANRFQSEIDALDATVNVLEEIRDILNSDDQQFLKLAELAEKLPAGNELRQPILDLIGLQQLQIANQSVLAERLTAFEQNFARDFGSTLATTTTATQGATIAAPLSSAVTSGQAQTATANQRTAEETASTADSTFRLTASMESLLAEVSRGNEQNRQADREINRNLVTIQQSLARAA